MSGQWIRWDTDNKATWPEDGADVLVAYRLAPIAPWCQKVAWLEWNELTAYDGSPLYIDPPEWVRLDEIWTVREGLQPQDIYWRPLPENPQ